MVRATLRSSRRLAANFPFLADFQGPYLHNCSKEQLKTVTDLLRNFVDGNLNPPVNIEQGLLQSAKVVKLIARLSLSLVKRRQLLLSDPKLLTAVEAFIAWFVNKYGSKVRKGK